ncbi:MAG: hypothetical protein ABR569_12805 [Gaiellaceae bacterium]
MCVLNALLPAWSLAPLTGMFLAICFASSIREAEGRTEAGASLRPRSD